MWQGKFITTVREGRWEYVNRARGIHAAVILAIDDTADGRHVLLVEQYRIPIHKRCIEMPAGLVGDDSAREEAAVAAARELEEETGYAAAQWENAGEFFSSPGMVGESFTLMIARGLTKVGEGGGVDGEDIVTHRVPLAGISDFIIAKRAAGCAIDVRVTMLLSGTWLG